MLPQLDVSTYSSQVFWLLISFSILSFFVYKFIIPSLNTIMNNREELIDRIIKDTNDFCTFSKREITHCKFLIDNAKKQEKDICDSAILEAKKTVESAVEFLKDEIEELYEISNEKIHEFRKKVYKNSISAAVNIAQVYYEKLSGSKVDDIDKLKEVIDKLAIDKWRDFNVINTSSY